MKPEIIALIILLYFGLLILVAQFTSRNAGNEGFFLGNRQSPWYIVAFGMIGASLSGVTFISVPGWVGTNQFAYLQMVLGYLLGYAVIANILLPLYYRLQLTSIYTYLDQRFGSSSYKTGAWFFLLSRTIGAAFRLFLVANVLQLAIFDAWNVPFVVTVIITIVLIWLYTFRGGIKTIVWTDSLQTLFMLLAVGFTIYYLGKDLQLSLGQMADTVIHSDYSRIWFFDDWQDKRHFIKQFLSGAFITIVMTGLDQDMMQKNLSCRSLPEAKKNVYWYGFAFIPVNILFMSLGVLLYIYAAREGIPFPERTDNIFPLIATGDFLAPIVGIFFMLGLMAAAYSSADSALTALTTSFTIDILGIQKKIKDKAKRIQIRKKVHVGFSFLLLLVIVLFRAINDQSVIESLFLVAGYTYGPLLGMYAFGLFTRRVVSDKRVPLIAVASPIVCLALYFISPFLFNGYVFGFEMLLINGGLTFTGLAMISKKSS